MLSLADILYLINQISNLLNIMTKFFNKLITMASIKLLYSIWQEFLGPKEINSKSKLRKSTENW